MPPPPSRPTYLSVLRTRKPPETPSLSTGRQGLLGAGQAGAAPPVAQEPHAHPRGTRALARLPWAGKQVLRAPASFVSVFLFLFCFVGFF